MNRHEQVMRIAWLKPLVGADEVFAMGLMIDACTARSDWPAATTKVSGWRRAQSLHSPAAPRPMA